MLMKEAIPVFALLSSPPRQNRWYQNFDIYLRKSDKISSKVGVIVCSYFVYVYRLLAFAFTDLFCLIENSFVLLVHHREVATTSGGGKETITERKRMVKEKLQ